MNSSSSSRLKGSPKRKKFPGATSGGGLSRGPIPLRDLRVSRRRYVIAPLSNGNIALMTSLAKFAGLPWDVILGAEIARHYKPDREVYISAYDSLDLKPEEVMMCACHASDLQLRPRPGCGQDSSFVPMNTATDRWRAGPGKAWGFRCGIHRHCQTWRDKWELNRLNEQSSAFEQRIGSIATHEVAIQHGWIFTICRAITAFRDTRGRRFR